MSYNPYTPPESPVADAPPAPGRPQPTAVTVAIVLLSLNLAFGTGRVFTMWREVGAGIVPMWELLWQFASIGLVIACAIAIGCGSAPAPEHRPDVGVQGETWRHVA